MYWLHHMGGVGWGGWIIGGLVMLLIIGMLAALVYFLVRAGSHNQSGGKHHSGSGAVEILKQRYARGDISKTEYQEMRQELET